MKYNKKTVFILATIMMGTLMLSSCKTVISVRLYDMWGVGIKVLNEEKSNFSAYVSIINDTPGLEGKITNWGFKIYSADTMVFEINDKNYNTLGFQVALSIPSPSYYTGGSLTLKLGIPFYKSRTKFVDTDLFAGKKPDKFEFTCTVQDINGGTAQVESGKIAIKYYKYDPNKD